MICFVSIFQRVVDGTDEALLERVTHTPAETTLLRRTESKQEATKREEVSPPWRVLVGALGNSSNPVVFGQSPLKLELREILIRRFVTRCILMSHESLGC